jgi:hypothetical protein
MEGAVALVPVAMTSAPLLLGLLPLGYLLAGRRPVQRWRLESGILLSLAAWSVSSPPPLEPPFGRVIIWIFVGLIPVLLGLVLWWRGGLLARSEVGASDVRTEFLILGAASLLMLVVLHGLAPAPRGLVEAAGLVFVLSGLVALGLARQDAADVRSSGGTRTLAGLAALAPTSGGVALAGLLTPALVAAMWAVFGNVLQVLLMPLLWLAQWLASLLPRFGPPAGLPQQLGRRPLPDLSELQREGGPPEWLGWLVLIAFLVLAIGIVVIVILLIRAWQAARRQSEERRESDIVAEQAGDAGRDARAMVRWLLAWLRRWLGRSTSARAGGRSESSVADGDARAAYRAMLAWARAEGLPRGTTETTQQFLARLVRHTPEAAETFELTTETYEWDRYGEVPPTRDRLATLRRGLELLRSQRPP